VAEQGKDRSTEAFDEQLDSSTGFFESTKHRLAEDLQRSYGTYAQANKESLRRVEQRLETRLRQTQQGEEAKALENTQKRPQRIYKIENRSARPKKTRWSRLSRFLSTIAAVLVVGAIVGSTAIVFDIKNRSASVGLADQTPISRVPCSDPSDPGEQYVCTNGLETPLNITTTTFDKREVTLFAGYADAQRILLKYMLHGPNIGAEPTMDLTMQGGIELGMGASGYILKKPLVKLANFSADKVPAGTKELQLTAHLRQVRYDGSKPAEDSVHFSLPFHAEKRVASINQTRNIGGASLILDHVTITPTQTSVYIKNDALARRGGFRQPDDIYLSVGNWNSHNKIDEVPWTSNNKTTGTTIGSILHINSPLMDQHGKWILTIQPGVVGGTGTLAGVFTFTVPVAQ